MAIEQENKKLTIELINFFNLTGCILADFPILTTSALLLYNFLDLSRKGIAGDCLAIFT